MFTLHYNYLGERYRSPEDLRDLIKENHKFSFSGNIFNCLHDDLTLRFGVKNLLDEDIIDPAPSNTYPNDFPRPGRFFWLNLTYDF